MLTVQILAAVIFGILCGRLCPSAPIWSLANPITTWALYALLFLIGIQLGSSREVWREISVHGLKLLLIPGGVALGSLVGGAVAGTILRLTLREALAVTAGFGWYSLAGVMLNQMGYAELGALAFLANVLRELLAIILIPIVARYLGNMAAIAPGGATTMDTTLPIIAEATGNEAIVAAFINGAILSALVPILIPLLMG